MFLILNFKVFSTLKYLGDFKNFDDLFRAFPKKEYLDFFNIDFRNKTDTKKYSLNRNGKFYTYVLFFGDAKNEPTYYLYSFENNNDLKEIIKEHLGKDCCMQFLYNVSEGKAAEMSVKNKHCCRWN